MKLTKGQIALWVTVIGGIITATIGGYFTFASGNSDALAEETKQRQGFDTAIIERVAVTETQYKNIEKRFDKVEVGIDELLKRTPK